MTSEQKLQAFESLLAELSGALADIVVAMQAKTDGTDEISATLVDLVTAIEGQTAGKSIDAIAQAIKDIRLEAPLVNVNVSPTPITIQPVVQVLERIQPCDYKLSVKYDNHDRITEALISRVG